MFEYSNPRKSLTVTDWPYGKFRTTATFEIESTKRGERAVRTTINPKNGRVNKPKKTTYSLKTRIVDGPDNRTYIARLTEFGFISFTQSDLQHDAGNIHPKDEHYAEALALFD